jgi:hypothetical protein
MGKKKVLKNRGKEVHEERGVGEKGLVRQFPAIFSFIFNLYVQGTKNY